MQNNSQPKLIPTPFADNGARQNIPNDSQIGITAGRASYADGFPPLTRTPLAAGGVPPFGTDFNGVLNDITAALRWSQSGAGYPFNAAFNTAISGYPKGARIPNSTLDGYWLNTTDGNTASPEVTGAATTGWVPAESYGVTAITGLSGSSATLTTLQAAKETIVLSGTLTSNVNLTVPAWIKQWKVINNCNGNFSVTVKTPNGTGVAVPSQSTSILSGDGVNINPGVNPGALINMQLFTASGTYTPTPGTKSIVVEVQAGGGGGGRTGYTAADKVSIATGGGGGGYAKSQLRVSEIYAPVAITVGNGGAPGTAYPGNGNKGGDSTFGSLITSVGGSGGYGQPQGTPPLSCTGQLGGNATGGNILNIPGGGSGGGSSASLTSSLVGNGGDSVLGSGGFSPTNTNVNGGDGRGYGAGGGGCNAASQPNTGFTGGKGAGGIIIVWEYA
ncbi:glycine-rich domain-containing protein [Pantoea agglomerans]|uniref:glycine-rich domain-containing protein n=1 Tax=Enterobacter agglomerans TaxID=549 RepID=UPI003209F212